MEKKETKKKIKAEVQTKIEKSDKTPVTSKSVKFTKKKKAKRNITSGIAYVYSTFNNTIISIADENGNVVSWSSAGSKDLKDLESQHHMQLKLLQMMQEAKHMNKG